MQSRFELYLKQLLKKRRFWLGVIALVVFSILFDFVFGTVLVVKSVTSGRWNSYLLVLGLVYIINNIYAYKVIKNKELKRISKLLWFLCFIVAWKLNGFFAALYFNFIITFSARILRIILPKVKYFYHIPAKEYPKY